MVQVGPEQLEVQECARPRVGDDDALLRIADVTIDVESEDAVETLVRAGTHKAVSITVEP